jgi:hypothetical protein
MKKSIILATVISALSIASATAGGFSWGVSFGIGWVGGCNAVYVPPVVCAPVVYTPVVYTQPVVQQVVYTQPVTYVPPPAPVCAIPVVNYYRPDCYRSPVTGTVWVGGSSGGHRHHGRR